MTAPKSVEMESVQGLRDAVRGSARTHAYDRYLSALLAPAEAREDLISLAAFLGEVSRIPLTSADVALGEIRLQWWRDAIDGFEAGQRSGSPVADAMGEVVRRRGLPTALLHAIVEGRSRELYEDGIPDEAAVTSYLEETEGAAFRVAALILGASASPEMDEAASAAARAVGSMRLALTLPLHISKQRLPLPASRHVAGRDPRGLDVGAAREALRGLTQGLAAEARDGVDHFRATQSLVPANIFAAFLPVSLVAPYLRALESPRHDLLLEIADISPLVRVVRIWLAHWRGRISER